MESRLSKLPVPADCCLFIAPFIGIGALNKVNFCGETDELSYFVGKLHCREAFVEEDDPSGCGPDTKTYS
uniref:Uncharacterized protein n=1 Tax=Arundo donax TaxID=35708 RepID=A0A0A9DLD3_ARUDO